MKYIKLFENSIYHFTKDYYTKYIDSLYEDIDFLKQNHIPYDLYYYNDNIFGACFKLYNFTTLSIDEKQMLKEHQFGITQNDYEFSWDWQKIKEKDIPLLIQTAKFNL